MVLNGPRHVPAMSPDRFGDTVRIIDNVLVKHKRRAAIYIHIYIYIYQKGRFANTVWS